MDTKIVGFDSDYDETSQMVANWRQQNAYQHLKADGHQVEPLAGNMATRMYLARELQREGVTFLTASGHGIFDEFHGSDGAAALQVGNFAAAEVKGKIIHLLSCYTAFELGPDLVSKGCIGFFGYDTAFQFFSEYMDDFMAPDAELDFALSQGKSCEQAYTAMMKVYQDKIRKLQSLGQFQYAASMDSNMRHVCSAMKHVQWGHPDSTI